ncbi:unnamed protein product [Aphanomyces euteiches]
MSSVAEPPKAAICVIANEVLSGKTLDTNSNHIAKFLFSRGIDLIRVSVIPDEMDVIVETVESVLRMTTLRMANAFNVPLELHEPTKQALEDLLTKSKRAIDLNQDILRMATFPKGCDILTTTTWVPIVKMHNVYVFPGIPNLMKQMLEANADHFKGIPIHQAIARTKQLEGLLAPALKAVAKEFPSVMIGSYVNHKEEGVSFKDRTYNVQVTLYSRVESDIREALPKVVAAIEGWVVEDVDAKQE